MESPLTGIEDVTRSVDALRFELDRCRLELGECRNSKERLENLFAHVADCIYVAEPGGRIIDANPAACELLGYTREELLTMHPWDFVTSASREEILGLTQNMRREVPTAVQRIYQRKTGERRAMDLRLTRFDSSGHDL